MKRRTLLFAMLVVSSLGSAAGAARFGFQTHVTNPPLTTRFGSLGHYYTGTERPNYVFELEFATSAPVGERTSIRLIVEQSQLVQTNRTPTSADDSSVMVDPEFEIDIDDEITGKTFSFNASGEISGDVSFMNPSTGLPYDASGGNGSSNVFTYIHSFDTNLRRTLSMTRGNVTYTLTPSVTMVHPLPMKGPEHVTGVEAYLDYSVERTTWQPGDFNHDGAVGTADYTAWRQRFGSVGIGQWEDGNCNGAVDAADYVIWRNGMIAGSGSGQSNLGETIPEPNVAVLLLIGVCNAVLRMRRAPCGFADLRGST